MPLSDALQFIEEFLSLRGIQHVYVGGIAVSSVSDPRATKDADVLLLLPPNDATRLVDDLEGHGIPIYKKARAIQKLVDGLPVKFLWSSKISFDLRFVTYSIDKNALRRSKLRHLRKYGITIPVASPEDVIVYKLARFSGLDQHDIHIIKKIIRPLDWEYIQHEVEVLSSEAGIPEMIDRLDIVIPPKRG